MLNREQLRYATSRLDGLYREMIEKLKKDCTTKKASVPLTGSELVKRLKSGAIKFKPGMEKVLIENYTYTRSIFELDEYFTGSVFDHKDYDARHKKLVAEYTKAMDELVIGDAKAALELIKAFAAKSF